MKYRFVGLGMGVLLLMGCASIDLSSEQDSPSPSTNLSVASPFVANPAILNLTQQLQLDYTSTPVQILRVGNEVKITYPADILFGVNNAVLMTNAHIYLDNLRQLMIENPNLLMRVDSFTDTAGGDEKNLSLSQLRAEAVALYFVDRDIVSTRITYKGYGNSNPIAENATAEGRAMNRRVVISFTLLPEKKEVVSQEKTLAG